MEITDELYTQALYNYWDGQGNPNPISYLIVSEYRKTHPIKTPICTPVSSNFSVDYYSLLNDEAKIHYCNRVGVTKEFADLELNKYKENNM